jgi:hypothetical protein
MSNLIAKNSKTEAYLAFIKKLNLSFNVIDILDFKQSPNLTLSGWQPIITLTCRDELDRVYEIDLRYAWGKEIWRQNYFDLAWDETRLLTKRQVSSAKLIVYLCEAETGLSVDRKLESVEKKYLIYPYWEKVEHLYLRLPLTHPFGNLELPQNYLTGYSTTRSFSQQSIIRAINSERAKSNLKLDFPKIEGGLRTKGLSKQDKSKQPLISVITVVYNGEEYLEQTIQSVINQSYDNVEYIIVDGGSTDGTLEIIQKYNDVIDYWVSAPDKGIYDAMNKGTTLALGRYTLHINADDLLFQPNSLNLAYSDANMAGLVLIFHPEEQIFKKRLNRSVDRDRYINAIRYPFHHQGFIGLRNSNSFFDPNYKIIADNLLMAKKISSEKTISLDTIIALHRREGVSAENNDAINRELLQAIAPSKNLRVYWAIYQKIIYSKLSDIAKALNLVTLKRKYL